MIIIFFNVFNPFTFLFKLLIYLFIQNIVNYLYNNNKKYFSPSILFKYIYIQFKFYY